MTPADLARALMGARRSGQGLRASDWVGAVRDAEQAYSVQDSIAQAWVVGHWKSGGASRSGPFSHSPLDPSGVGARCAPDLLGVEAEIALRLGRDVSPAQALALRPDEAGDWVDAMAVSAELISSRWLEGLAAPELLRMADLQSNAGLRLGPWRAFRPLDWASLAWRLEQPGLPSIERVGGHSLNDPTGVLPAWLRHLTRRGQTVPAGTVVTTGAWGGLHPLGAGELRLSFAGLEDLVFSAARA